MACPGCCSALHGGGFTTHATLFISPPLHLSLISSISPLLITGVVHNQAPGPETYCQKGARDPIFPTVEVLLARLDKRRVSSATMQGKHTRSPHTETDTQPAVSSPNRWDLFQPQSGLCRCNLTINQHVVHSGVTGQDNTLRN